MKKLVKILALVLVIATFCMALVACKPDDGPEDVQRLDYLVTPLADLTDYSSDSNAAVTYSQDAKTTAEGQLQTKITSLNNNYPEDTLNVMQKILKNADATAFVNALEFSGLPTDQMKDLVKYISTGTSVADAKDKPTEATGLIEDYSAIQEWTDELPDDTTSQTYKDIYKKRADKSYAMNTKLASIGTSNGGPAMNGGQAARALIEVIQYAETVIDGQNMANGAEMTNYFKTVLYDVIYDAVDADGDGVYEKGTEYKWDTSAYSILITIRSFNHLRWGTAGQTKSAIIKNVGDPAYVKPDADKTLVKAWGYSYDYEMATYKALTRPEYDKNVQYTLKDSLTDAEALEAADIQQKLYTKAYRYSADFYVSKYTPAMEPVSRIEELYEACVYGFIADDNLSWGNVNFGAESINLTVAGNTTGDKKTEQNIVFKAGALDTRYSTQFKKGVDAGMAEFLLSSDMEYYYSLTDANVIAQAKAQRTMDGSKDDKSGNTYNNALFDLDMENLKSTKFIIDEFLKEETGSAELGSILTYQIYNYQSDYVRSINQLKAKIAMDIQSLVNAGAYEESVAGTYTLVGGHVLTTDEYDTVYDIGYNCAILDSMTNEFGEFDLTSQLNNVGNVVWKSTDTTIGINDNITSAVEKDYSSKSGSAKVTELQNTLIKKVWAHKSDSSKPTFNSREEITSDLDSENYVEKYDESHQLSRLLLNHEKVMYYTAGQVEITLKKGDGFSSSTGITWKNHTTQEGDTLMGGYEDAISTFEKSSLFTNPAATDIVAENKTYEPEAGGKWYLRAIYDSATGNMNNYYQVTENDAFRYNVTLYLGYKIK